MSLRPQQGPSHGICSPAHKQIKNTRRPEGVLLRFVARVPATRASGRHLLRQRILRGSAPDDRRGGSLLLRGRRCRCRGGVFYPGGVTKRAQPSGEATCWSEAAGEIAGNSCQRLGGASSAASILSGVPMQGRPLDQQESSGSTPCRDDSGKKTSQRTTIRQDAFPPGPDGG